MTTLALDLGTKCGWAVMRDGTLENSGVWDLSPKRGDSSGMRFVHFRGRLRAMREGYPDIGDVVYELAVGGYRGNYAPELYGGFQATLTTWCQDHSIRYQGVPVGTLKKWATGKGSAKKDMMVEAACKRTGLDITDHDQADAVLLALYAAEQEGGR
jgi:hypothetical protein